MTKQTANSKTVPTQETERVAWSTNTKRHQLSSQNNHAPQQMCAQKYSKIYQISLKHNVLTQIKNGNLLIYVSAFQPKIAATKSE